MVLNLIPSAVVAFTLWVFGRERSIVGVEDKEDNLGIKPQN